MVFLGIYLGLSMGKVRQQKFLKFLIIADQMLSFLIGVFHVKREGEIGFYLR